MQTTCKNRKYTDHTIDAALRAMRLRGVSKIYVLNKKVCLKCKAWHVVRERIARTDSR
jgi:hypothetical protein